MKVADLVEALRRLDPELEVAATVTRIRFLSDDEAAACRLPNGKWKPTTLCCKATGHPVEFIQVPLDWRNDVERAADKRRPLMTPNEALADSGAPQGCVCPPGAERGCRTPFCPRHHPLEGALETTGRP